MVRRMLWERPLDIFKLIVAIILAIALVVLPLRPGSETLVKASPAFIHPKSGATFGDQELRALEGTAEPGATVRFFDGENLLGEATADAQGKVELPLPTPLPEGPHNVRAVVVDKNGKEVAVSEPLAFTIIPSLAIPVTPAITQPASGATFAADEVPTLEGTATPGATVQIFEGATLLGETTVDADGQWRFELPEALAEGPHTLRFVVLDEAGREISASEPVAFTIIPAMAAIPTPAITSLLAETSIAAGEPVLLEGTAAPGATMQIYDGETLLGETTADAAGRWRFQVPTPLAEGEHALRTVLLDVEGVEVATSEPAAVTVRAAATPAPTPAITSLPAGASIAAGEPVLLEGTAAPGATMQIYDDETLLGETTADAAGRWRFQVPTPLAEGEHALRTVVLDVEGGEVATSEPAAVTVRAAATPAPTPAITSLPAGASIAAGEPVLLEGTAAPGATVQIYDSETLLGETTADAAGRWRFQPPTALAEGEHVLRTVAVNAQGQEVAASAAVTFGVAKAAQAPVILLPKGMAVIAGGPLEGTADPDARLRIYADTTLLGETVAGADGLWAFRLPADMSTGALTLRVVAVDDAGRVLAESSPTLVEVLELLLPVTGGHK